MISFVIPAYNEEALLASCIASIVVEMNTDYEIIVVDNGSTDLTADIARYFSTKVISEPTKGVVWARQAGYAEAQGDLIAFIDADSEVPNGWLAIMLRAMSDNRVVACSGPLVYTDMNLAKRIMTSAFYTIGSLLSRILPMVQGGNFVARKSALKAVDGFDTSIEFYGEDTKTAIRLSRVGRVAFVPGMFVWSSARRLNAEGFLTIGARYLINYLWMQLTGRAWSKSYRDVRSSN